MKGDTLKKWESTLNLCVHAHGYDVELIMKAPCNGNYPLDIHSSCIYDWIPCGHGSDHDYSPLIPFIKQRGALVFYQSTIEFNFYRISPSRINPPGISTIFRHCTTSCDFLLVRYFSLIFCKSADSGLPSTKNT